LIALLLLTTGLSSCGARGTGSSVGDKGVIAVGEPGEQPPVPETRWVLLKWKHYLNLTND